MFRITPHVRSVTLGLLLFSGMSLAQDTTAPTTPAPPTDTTTPATPVTPTAPATTPAAPATTDTAAPATTPVTTSALPDNLPTLAPLEGEKALKTVQTVLGQAVIYSAGTKDVLTRTLEQLKAQGYTVKEQSGNAALLEKGGQTVQLSVSQKVGVTVATLSRDVAAAAARVSAPGTDAPAATDTTAPATTGSSSSAGTSTEATDTESTDADSTDATAPATEDGTKPTTPAAPTTPTTPEPPKAP